MIFCVIDTLVVFSFAWQVCLIFFKYSKVKLRLSINPSIIHSHSSAQFTGNLKDTSSDRPYSGRIQKKMTRYFSFKNNKSNISAFTRQSS